MITEKDKETIIQCARKYDVSSVYLFGSSTVEGAEANDIDLAVNGIVPRLFFKFYGELLRSLSKPVDLVDLSQKSLFNQIVEERGGAKSMDVDAARREPAEGMGAIRD